MKLKMSLLVTAIFSTLAIAIAGSFSAPPEPLGQPAPSANWAESKLFPPQLIQNDELPNTTLDQQFSLDSSLTHIYQIDQALTTFHQLAEKSPSVLARTVTDINHPPLEQQTLGFHTWVGSVEGALRQQHYQIKKLEFELAQKQYQDGEIPKAVLDQKAADYQKAVSDFHKFWTGFHHAE